MRVPPILVGLALGVGGALALSGPMFRAVDRLGEARAERAALDAALAAPVSVPDLPAIEARDAAAAGAGLAARVKQGAAKGGLLVEEAGALDAPAGVARLRFRVSGREGAVIALADAIERDAPFARLAAWRIERSGGAVRLSAEVVAPWR